MTSQVVASFLVSLFFISTITSTHSLKILGLFPNPAYSHFLVFNPIMRALSDAGHDVTVVSPFPDKDAPTNYQDLKLPSPPVLTNFLNLEIASHRTSYQSFRDFFSIFEQGANVCENSLNSTAIQTVMKQKFDVILMELFNCDCMMGVAWKINAPVIGLSSCALIPWHYNIVGSPVIPSYMPTVNSGYSESMSYWERVSNWFIINAINLLYKHVAVENLDAIMRKHLQDENMPHLSELVKDTSMILVNSHYSLEGSRPYAPTIVEIGGIHIKEENPLDAELKAVLDSAKDGVIYVSWGSMIRSDTLPVDKRNGLLKAFGSLKQQVVWKWENDTLPDQPKNVYIRKWMPQRDILCHPNVRVFLSHGGLMGTTESVYCGVPMVLTPLFGDQFHNAGAAKARGIGWILPFEDINEKTVKAAINNALSPITRDNAKRVSFSFKNRPQTPNKTAVWWVEHVAATRGAPLLQSHSKNLTTIEYYSIDVLTMMATALIIPIVLFYLVLRKCFQNSNTASNDRKSKSE